MREYINIKNNENKMKKILLTLLIGIFLINFSSAVDDIGIVKQNDCIDLYNYCPTCSYINLTAIKYPNGSIDITNLAMIKTGNNYRYEFCNTSLLGEYSYTTCGDKAGIETCEKINFEVTPSGYLPNTAKSILNIGLLSFLILLFVASLIGIVKVEHYIGRFALYWVCHVLTIAITFIAWHMAEQNLITGGAIAGIFKVLFYFVTIAFFPMLILSIVWIVYIHLFNEHFQKLIDKGENVETAFAITQQKRGGWFNGKK